MCAVLSLPLPQAYITNLNAALEKQADAEAKGDVASLIALQPALKFNGGGHVNHTIFWTNLAPASKGGGGAPEGELATYINKAFGSFDVRAAFWCLCVWPMSKALVLPCVLCLCVYGWECRVVHVCVPACASCVCVWCAPSFTGVQDEAGGGCCWRAGLRLGVAGLQQGH